MVGMTMDADSIVRVVKRGAPPPDVDATLSVVGIDDWARQKGQQHFGTIFVDFERRRVVDVLAVRTADAVAAWIAAHPAFGSSAVIATGHMPMRRKPRVPVSQLLPALTFQARETTGTSGPLANDGSINRANPTLLTTFRSTSRAPRGPGPTPPPAAPSRWFRCGAPR
jgi:hypothetical protein